MTGYILNYFGQYENRGKEKGITINYAGVPFWLPYGKVTAIPDFHFREVDHAATAEEWENGNTNALIYQVFRTPGVRVVEELTEVQEPIKNKEKGIIPIQYNSQRAAKDKYVKAPAGWDEDGKPLFEEVPVITATADEIALAETAATEYKRFKIEEYFQSKRQRMAGEQGFLAPVGLVKTFMKELGVEDIDQVTISQQAKAKSEGLSPAAANDFLALLAQALTKGISGDEALKLAQKASGKVAQSKEELEKALAE